MKASMTLKEGKKGSVRFNADGKNEDGSPAAMESAYVSREALTAEGHDPDKVKKVLVEVTVVE